MPTARIFLSISGEGVHRAFCIRHPRSLFDRNRCVHARRYPVPRRPAFPPPPLRFHVKREQRVGMILQIFDMGRTARRYDRRYRELMPISMPYESARRVPRVRTWSVWKDASRIEARDSYARLPSDGIFHSVLRWCDRLCGSIPRGRSDCAPSAAFFTKSRRFMVYSRHKPSKPWKSHGLFSV